MSCLTPRTLLSEKLEYSQAMVLEIMKHLDGERQKQIQEDIQAQGGEVDMIDFVKLLKNQLSEFIQTDSNSTEAMVSTEEELVSDLCELFLAIDVNGDGTLEWDEFVAFIVEKASLYTEAEQQEDEIGRYTTVKPEKTQKKARSWNPSKSKKTKDTRSGIRVRIGVGDENDTEDENPINKLYYVDALDSLVVLRENCQTVKIYDVQDMSELGRISGYSGLPICAEYMRGWSNKTLEDSASRMRKHKGRNDVQIPVTNLNRSAGHLATACSDMTINIWDLQPGANQYQVVSRWRAPHAQTALCWLDEHQVLFSAGVSGLIHSWDVNKRTEKSYFLAHDDICSALTSISSLDSLISGGMDSLVCVWDMHTGAQQQVFHGHHRGVTSLAYCEQNRLIISAGIDHEAYVWSPFAPTLLYKLKGHSDSLIGVHTVQNNPHQVITADASGFFKVWDVRNFQCVQSVSLDPEEIPSLQTIQSFAVCPGKALPSEIPGSDGAEIDLKEAAAAAVNRPPSPPYITRVAAASNNIHFLDQKDPVDHMVTDDFPIISALFNTIFLSIITCAGRTVKIWNSLTGKRIKTFENIATADITCMCLDDRERKFILGDHSGKITVYNYANGAVMKYFDPHSSEVSSLVYCLNMKAVVSTSWDRTIALHSELDAEKGIKLREMDNMQMHTDDITTSDINEKLGLVVTGSLDNDFKVWVLESGNIHGKGTHQADITKVKILGDVPIVAVADDLGIVDFWALHPAPAHYEKLDRVVFYRNLRYGEDESKNTREVGDAEGKANNDNIDQKVEAGLDGETKTRCLNNEDDERSTVLAMDWCQELKLLVTGDEFGTIRAFKINNDIENFSLELAWNIENAHSDGITSVQVPDNFDFVLSSSFDCCVRTFSVVDGTPHGALIEGAGRKQKRSQFWHLPFPKMDEMEHRKQLETKKAILDIEGRVMTKDKQNSKGKEQKITESSKVPNLDKTDSRSQKEEKSEYNEAVFTPRTKRRNLLRVILKE